MLTFYADYSVEYWIHELAFDTGTFTLEGDTLVINGYSYTVDPLDLATSVQVELYGDGPLSGRYYLSVDLDGY